MDHAVWSMKTVAIGVTAPRLSLQGLGSLETFASTTIQKFVQALDNCNSQEDSLIMVSDLSWFDSNKVMKASPAQPLFFF
jgi:hypothetical protein